MTASRARRFGSTFVLLVVVLATLAGCERRPEGAPGRGDPASEVAGEAGLAGADLALIDAAGRDLAERRVIDVYRRVSPSVVNVTTQVLATSFFYGVVPQEGAGSGFVLDREGHVLTNFHVVEGARRIEVSFEGGEVLPAQLVGTDARNDLALLRVDAPPRRLTPVELGRSADLQVGQRAIAIGNPFGEFGRTLTTGVVSALGRRLEGPEGRDIGGVIQTDAAINRGNSGGPLLDSAGRVIGVSTAIFSPTGTSAGVGFAVPVDTVRRVLPDLKRLGRYRHPWLGVRLAHELNPTLAAALRLPLETGLLLVQVAPGSPLALAGARGAQREVVLGNRRLLLGGDVLTRLDDRPVTDLAELQLSLEEGYAVGDEVTVTLWRDGREVRRRVTLSAEP